MIVLNRLLIIHSFGQWPLILSPVSRLILIVMILSSRVPWKCFAWGEMKWSEVVVYWLTSLIVCGRSLCCYSLLTCLTICLLLCVFSAFLYFASISKVPLIA